jgi:hypothetical protein
MKALPRTNHELSLANVLAQLNACILTKVERRSLIISMHKALPATPIGMLLSPSPGSARPRTLTQSAIHCMSSLLLRLPLMSANWHYPSMNADLALSPRLKRWLTACKQGCKRVAVQVRRHYGVENAGPLPEGAQLVERAEVRSEC